METQPGRPEVDRTVAVVVDAVVARERAGVLRVVRGSSNRDPAGTSIRSVAVL
jgi:hypothetical protein